MMARCIEVLVSAFVLLLAIEDSMSVNVFESTPSSESGILAICAGQQISLMCSHDNVITGGTRWIASPPVNCLTDISHNSANPPTPAPCGPFMFREITPLVPVPSILNSTATAAATVNMTGTRIECRGGNSVNSFSVDNISLSIIDTTATNLEAIQTSPTEVQLEWLISPDADSCDVSLTFLVDIEGSEGVNFVNSSSGNDTQLIVSLPPGSYTFNVISISGNERLISQDKSFDMINSVPSRPTNINIEADASLCVLNQVAVSWDAPPVTLTTPDVLHYCFKYGRIVPGRDEVVDVVAYNTTNTTIIIPGNNFSSNAEYIFSVTAVNVAGNSEVASNISSVSPSITSSTVIRINDTTVVIDFVADPNCIQPNLLFEVQHVRCPITGECICNGELTYTFRASVSTNSIRLTNLLAGNRYCYRLRVTRPVVSQWIYPPNGTFFLTLNVYRPPNIGAASFVTGETYQCDGSLNGFGGSRRQTSAVFLVDEGQWILTEECRVLSWIVAVIVIIIILVVAAILVGVGIGGYVYYKKCGNVSEENRELKSEEAIEMKSEPSFEPGTYADPNSIEHEEAPDGEQYAMVDKSTKRKKVDVSTPQTLYQDPNSIKHKEAPTGDFYAMPQQKGKKGKNQVSSDPGGADVASMYSTVDTSRKNQQLTYAQLDVGSGHGDRPVPQSTPYATVVT